MWFPGVVWLPYERGERGTLRPITQSTVTIAAQTGAESWRGAQGGEPALEMQGAAMETLS